MAGQKDNSRDSGRFITLPVSVLDSKTYQALSFSARAMLIDIFSQFKGENNGSLVACDKFLKPRGWRSKATIFKAVKELRDSGLLILTRQGMRPNKASLYGVAWFGLGKRVDASKLDISGRMFESERHAWKAKERLIVNIIRPPIIGVRGIQIAPKNEVNTEALGSENEPIYLKSAVPLPQNMGAF